MKTTPSLVERSSAMALLLFLCFTAMRCDDSLVNPRPIGVNEVNKAPVAMADTAFTSISDPVRINLVRNDTDADGTINPKSVVIATLPTNGQLSPPDTVGGVWYTPNPGFKGDDRFTYTIRDNFRKTSEPGEVLIRVDDNRPPETNDDETVTNEDTPVTIAVLINDIDLDGMLNPATVAVTFGPDHGSIEDLNLATGQLTYLPAPDYAGTDQFTYTVRDNDNVLSPEATVTLTINPINDAPRPTRDSTLTDVAIPVTVDVLQNDVDVDGSIDRASLSLITEPQHGTATINADATIAYTPNAGFLRTDSLQYKVADELGRLSEAGTVIIRVKAPPIANADSAITPRNLDAEIDLLANDTDSDGTLDFSSLTIMDLPSNGRLIKVDREAGSVIYRPDQTFVGSDLFTYTITDNEGVVSVPASVSIRVGAPPVAQDDNATTTEDVPILISVLGNDADSDGFLVLSSIEVVDASNGGRAVVNPEGTINFEPNLHFSGTTEFTYIVRDNDGFASNPATVTVDLVPVPDPPEISNPGPQTNRNSEEIRLTIRAVDPDGDALVYTADTLPPGLAIDPGFGRIEGTLSAGASGGSPYRTTVCVDDDSFPLVCTTFVWTVNP